MAFPNGARLRTYGPGQQIKSADLNALQDADIAAYDELFKKRIILGDDFVGQSIGSGNWKTPSGTVSVVDDSTNGGSGAAKVDATGGGANLVETQPLAWAGDFLLKGRIRVTGVTSGSSIGFGLRTVGGTETGFLIDGSNSTTNWRVLVASNSTAPNGTAVAVNSAYAEFELKRVGTLVTLSIGGVLLHSLTSPTLTGNTVRLNANGAGIIFADYVRLRSA